MSKDRTRGGGLTFLLHISDSSESYMEFVGVAAKCEIAVVEVINIYIPPLNSCDPRYMPNISSHLVGNNRLVLAGFNAHYKLWHTVRGNDQRGMTLAEPINSSTIWTVDEPHPPE